MWIEGYQLQPDRVELIGGPLDGMFLELVSAAAMPQTVHIRADVVANDTLVRHATFTYVRAIGELDFVYDGEA